MITTITTFFAGLALTISGFFGGTTLGAQPALTVPQGGTGWSAIAPGTLVYGTGSGLRLATTSTTTASCSGSASCTPFTIIGSSPITISATGGSGGTTAVSTSSSETSGRVPFWTSTAGTPAELSGGVAGFAWNDTFKRLTATYASSTTFSATTMYGALVGNADTATALAADPANCSAGNAPLGIVASGAVEGCFDVWTEAENTSAAYISDGNTNWDNIYGFTTFAYPFTPFTSWYSTSTIELNTGGFMTPASSSVAFLDSVRATSTDFISTNATTSALRVSGVLSFGGVAGDAWTDFCTSITGSAGLCDGDDAVGSSGSTDAVLWANASTSNWAPLSILTLSSSTIHKLNSTYTSTTQGTILTSLFIGDGQVGDDGIFFNSFAPNSSDYELRVLDQTTVDSRGLDLSIIGAAGNGIGSGGDINVAAGGGGVTGRGGGISITSGDGGVTSGNGGTFDFNAGNAQGSGIGGGIQFSAGNGVANAGGAVSFFGGAGTVGGDIFFAPGDGSSTDGSVQIYNIAQTVTAAFNVQSLSTNRVFTFPDSSGTFCLTTTCATFSYPFTPATSWFSTSTIMLNTAGFMSTASSTFHSLRSGYSSSTIYASFATASTSALIISGIGSAANGCLTVTSAGVVGAAPCASGGGADYNKWATSTGSMLGINPLTAFFVGIGTSTPRSLLHLATSTAPQITISDGFASYDSWNFRTVGGTFFLATSSMATNATSSLSVLTIGSDGVVNFGNRINTCIALTGSSDLCDGVDSGGVGGTSAASKWATTTGMLSIYPAGGLRIGVGTTSPYGLFSANGNTWPQLMLSDNNLTAGMRHWVASTTPLGKLVWGTINDAFTTITSVMTLSTSTIDYAGYPAGFSVGTSTAGAYHGLGTSTDQFFLNGRINTGDWHFNECQSTGSRTAQVTADQTGSVQSVTLGSACPGWMFNEDNAGVLDETVMNGYSYFRLRAGATGVTNAAAGDGFGIQHTTAWMNFASNTPKISALRRFGAIQNATTSLYMIGFGSQTGTAADHAALPTYFVGVVSSTTESNFIAVIKNGNTWQYKNTGIASSSVLSGETAWGTWDVEVSSTTAIFRYRGTNGIATTTNHLVTGGADGTEAYIPTHNGLRINPVVSTGKPTAGLQQELHVRWIRLWWRDIIQ